jgi:hypothetical protein
LGGRSAAAGANVGQFLSRGGTGAALTSQAGQFDPFSYALQGLGQNRQFGQGLAGQALNMRYGAENVYGPYGRGTIPELTNYDTY